MNECIIYNSNKKSLNGNELYILYIYLAYIYEIKRIQNMRMITNYINITGHRV